MLTQSILRCQLRRGIPIFTHTYVDIVLTIPSTDLSKCLCCYRSTNMNDMQCMLQISPTRLLMGGHQDKIIDFNLTRGKETGLVRIC